MPHEHEFLQRCQRRPSMKAVLLLFLIAGMLLLAWFGLSPQLQGLTGDHQDAAGGGGAPDNASVSQGMVLDISAHSLDELRVLLDRAETVAMRPQPQGEKAGIVLVLHGPEVEFFAISNYSRYRDIVDQAARLDAFDVVDVRICRSMMEKLGVEQDDIPAFIEQVPYGPGEVGRLVREGYVYF